MRVPYPETVTVVRMVVGKHGARTPGDSHDVDGCAVYPRATKASTNVTRGGNESLVAEDLVEFGLAVLMPAGSDVLATDQVIARGKTYEVDGQPADWWSPLSNFAPGREVLLKQETG